MFRHVLVALDGTSLSKATLMTAVAIVNEFQAKLTLLYVIDLAREYANAALTVIPDADVERHEARIQNFLSDASSLVYEYGGTCCTRVAHGTPVHKVINTVAAELNADVIAMSTHDRRGFARALWGSVTESVRKEAGVPVLIVHESGSKRRPHERAAGTL